MRLTPLKQRIYDVVRRAAWHGISGDRLFAIVFDGRLPRYQGGRSGRGETRQRSTLKSNIWQINQQLRGQRIIGSKCSGGWYWLKKH